MERYGNDAARRDHQRAGTEARSAARPVCVIARPTCAKGGQTQFRFVQRLWLVPRRPPTMKLTPELIQSVPSTLNPIKERQLDFRGAFCPPPALNGSLEVWLTGYTIPAIENLGITKVRVSVPLCVAIWAGIYVGFMLSLAGSA